MDRTKATGGKPATPKAAPTDAELAELQKAAEAQAKSDAEAKAKADADAMAAARAEAAARARLVRITPKAAPFRRAGISFATLVAVIVPAETLSLPQMIQLGEEPLVDVDVSEDGGETWTRLSVDPLRERWVQSFAQGDPLAAPGTGRGR